MRILLISAAALMATGCDMGAKLNGGSEDAGTQTAAPKDVLKDFRPDFRVVPDAAIVENLSIGDGLSAVHNENNSVTISGTATSDSSAGPTSGVAFRFGNEAESAASSHQITVRIVAKGTPGEKFKAAYSTNEVGNSNWREFPLNAEWEEYTFEYAVPAMAYGRADFIGIQPMTGPVTIGAVGIDIGEQLTPQETEAVVAPVEEAAPAADPASDEMVDETASEELE